MYPTHFTQFKHCRHTNSWLTNLKKKNIFLSYTYFLLIKFITLNHCNSRCTWKAAPAALFLRLSFCWLSKSKDPAKCRQLFINLSCALRNTCLCSTWYIILNMFSRRLTIARWNNVRFISSVRYIALGNEPKISSIISWTPIHDAVFTGTPSIKDAFEWSNLTISEQRHFTSSSAWWLVVFISWMLLICGTVSQIMHSI